RRPLRFLRRRLFLVVIVLVAFCREQLGKLWGGPVRGMAPIEKATQRRTDDERGDGVEQSRQSAMKCSEHSMPLAPAVRRCDGHNTNRVKTRLRVATIVAVHRTSAA